jgi:hypothetical protein
MAMQWQQAPIQFNSGINQKTDDKQVVPGQWLVLENLEMQKTGRFKKRRGFTRGSLSQYATTIVGTKLGAKLLPPSDSLPIKALPFIDYGLALGLNNLSAACGCIDKSGNRAAVYAFRTWPYNKLSIMWRTYDSSGVPVSDVKKYDANYDGLGFSRFVGISDTTDNAYTSGPCAAVMIFDAISPSGNSTVAVISNGTTKVIASGINSANISAHGNGLNVYVVYSDITAGNTKVVRYDLSNGTLTSTTIAVNNEATAVTCDGVYVYVSVYQTVYRYNLDLTGVTTKQTVANGTVLSIARNGIAISSDATNSWLTTLTGTTYSLPNVIPAGTQPFEVGANTYAVFYQSGYNVNTEIPAGGYIIKCITPEVLVAKGDTIECGCLYGFGTNFLGMSQPLGGLVSIPTRRSLMLTRWEADNYLVDGIKSSAVTIANDIIYRTSNLKVLLGAQTSGDSSCTLGFWYSPIISTVASNANAGSGLPTGEYRFLAVLEQQSPSGNIIRAVNSTVYTYTVVTANRGLDVTIKCPTLEASRLTNSLLSVFILTPGETVWLSYIEGIKIAGIQTVSGGAMPLKQRALYTTGGVLEDRPPPTPIGAVSIAKNRIWVMSAEAEEVWFSDVIFPGELPLFNEACTLPLPQGGGDGFFAVEIDGKIVVFQKYQISVTYGDGPNQDGSSNFPDLQIVARDIGTINSNTVITTNDGIFFLSSKGLWLLDRGLQLQFIGTGIDDDASSIVCGAKLTDSEQIWFFTTTKACIWDNYHKLWTTAPTGLTGITDASVIDNTLHVIAGGYDYTLTSATTDNGAAITVKAKTGWISLSGLKGFERIRRIMFLCDQESSTTMTVKLRYNFIDTVAETFTVTSADIVDSGGNVQWIMRPKIQKCECFQIEFETSSSGATLEISSIALEYGIKSGLFRVPASKKIGGV